LVKEPSSCLGCGVCRRNCPLDIEAIEKDQSQVQTVECLNCLKCLRSCRATGALSLRFLNFKIFESSRWRKGLKE
jgi:ferredoxin